MGVSSSPRGGAHCALPREGSSEVRRSWNRAGGEGTEARQSLQPWDRGELWVLELLVSQCGQGGPDDSCPFGGQALR